MDSICLWHGTQLISCSSDSSIVIIMQPVIFIIRACTRVNHEDFVCTQDAATTSACQLHQLGAFLHLQSSRSLRRMRRTGCHGLHARRVPTS